MDLHVNTAEIPAVGQTSIVQLSKDKPFPRLSITCVRPDGYKLCRENHEAT